MHRDMLKGHVDAVVLAILSRGDTYGYAIAKQVNDRSEGVLSLKEGTLYPCLRRLEAEGYVEGYWGGDDDGPRRRYYALTDRGRKHLEHLRAAWSVQQRVIGRLLEEGNA
ncbi:MAG: PadR family transcriptional regulator [Alicyclobacillus sp.]|nr:PadR family transcriptional regulator [Alicyclobacillus sp.]